MVIMIMIINSITIMILSHPPPGLQVLGLQAGDCILGGGTEDVGGWDKTIMMIVIIIMISIITTITVMVLSHPPSRTPGARPPSWGLLHPGVVGGGPQMMMLMMMMGVVMMMM